MPKFRTTPVQRSGFRFLKNRILRAANERSTSERPTTTVYHKKALALGVVGFTLFGGAGAAVKLINQDPDIGDDTYVITDSGAQFVKYNGYWHEVMNTASARLLLGSPEDPKSVKDGALDDVLRGQMIGILGAPSNFESRSDEFAQWSTCTQYSPSSRTNLLETESVDTITVAGDELDTRARALEDNNGVVVTDLERGTVWLVLGSGSKVLIDTDNNAVMNALGISDEDVDNATSVSTQMLSTMDTLPDLDTPTVDNQNETSTAISDYNNGTVLVSDMPDGKEYYIVGDAGVQRINSFVARLASATGGVVLENISPQRISSFPQAEDVIDLSLYPRATAEIKVGKSVCSTWEKTANTADASKTVYIADTLPMETAKTDNAVELMPSAGTGRPTADFSYTTPGSGWFVRATSLDNESLQQGNLFWISDSGVYYPIAPDEEGSFDSTVEALGLSGSLPHSIPQEFLDLYTPGPSLSKTDAEALHARPEVASGGVAESGEE